MDVIRHVDEFYAWAWTERDVRVDGWLMTSSVRPVLLLLVLYFAIVIYGPKWMRHRQPFKLKWTLFVYNMFIAICSAHFFNELAFVSYKLGYNWWCEPVRYSKDPEEMRIARAFHLFFIFKAVEFLDTVFIIARKKNDQLTGYHIYHHASAFPMAWLLARWMPGGSAALGASVNLFNHTLMYSYFGLSALGPRVSKYLWWKKLLPLLQLGQFVTGMVILAHMAIYGCRVNQWFQRIGVVYLSSFIILFVGVCIPHRSLRKTREECD